MSHSEESLAELARHGSYPDKWRLSGRADLPVGVLEILLNDEDDNIVRATLQNPRVTTAMLQQLAV
jgi:hypothetical protein